MMSIDGAEIFASGELEKLLDDAKLGLWSWDFASDTIRLTHSAARILGVDRTRLSSTEALKHASIPEHGKAAQACFDTWLSAAQEILMADLEISSSAGLGRVELKGRIEYDAEKRPQRAFGVLRDVTELRAKSAEADRTRELFALFTELASDYVYLADFRKPTLTPEIVAGSFERTTGYRPEEIAGQGGWFELMHPEDRKNIADLMAVLRSGRTFVNEYRIRTRFGEYRWLRDHARPILDPQTGELIQVVGGVADITEKKLLAEQINRSQELEALARMSGAIAHDFNNLLTVMLSAVSILERGAMTPTSLSATSDLKRAVDRAAELSGSLMAFARKRPMIARLVLADDTIQSFIPMLKRAAGERIEFKVSRAAQDAKLAVDPTQLELALLNLVINARDAMEGQGTVRLETHVVDFAHGELRRPPELEPGQFIAIDLIDSGPGIPPEILGQVFEPFFTTKSPGRGTGLGLSTVHGVARQFGGSVAVESTLGQGCRFTLFFPVATGEQDLDPPGPARHSIGGRETIWVVEDEPLVRSMVLRVLEEHGYRVRGFESAERLLEEDANAISEVQLLLTDVRLPGMPGTELALQITGTEPGLRILLMSGMVDDAEQQEVVMSGRFPLLTKPFLPEGLARAVRATLEGRPFDH